MALTSRFGTRFCFVLFVGLLCTWPAFAADKKAADTGKVSGLYIEKNDKENVLLVKADGEDEPVKYKIDPSDKQLAQAWKSIFNAARVEIAYKTVGEERQLVGIRKPPSKMTSGTVTGNVVKVYNDFWVEVKPKNSVSDGYALGPANWKNQTAIDQLKSLQPGDSVTIAYYTDGERHRIQTLRKNASAPTKTSN